MYDLSINGHRRIPPTGHAAKIVARTDFERGVHKTPAHEEIRETLDLEFPVSRSRPGHPTWGGRTWSSDPEWRYVNVRRLAIFVEESIHEGTQWVVSEPNADQ